MSSSSSFSSVHSNPSANMPYEIEEELLESENSDFDADHEGSHVDDDSDIEAYFDQPIDLFHNDVSSIERPVLGHLLTQHFFNTN